MLGLFASREWKPEVLPEMSGSYQRIKVKVRNFPCLREAKSEIRQFATADFGNVFLMALCEQLGDFKFLRARMQTGAEVHAFVTLAAYSPIAVEISGDPDISREQFNSELADALIEAFKSVRLRAR